MATIEHLTSSASTDDIVGVIERDGAVILEEVLATAEIERLNLELAPFLAKGVYCRDEFTGFKTQRIGALVARSVACGDLALNPLMLASARQYLKQYCDDVQLHFTSAVAIAPG